jgi:hypothetical protein
MVNIFFAYPRQPEATAETVALAAGHLDTRPGVTAKTWQDLAVTGRLVLGQITDAICAADLVCCELGSINPNVLFELGYAIAKQKAVWILLDTTDTEAHRKWNQFGLLSSVGYVGYTHSGDIQSRILGGLSQLHPLWDDVAHPTLPIQHARTIFYMPLNHATDASRTLTRRLDAAARKNWHINAADTSEIGPAPISWYLPNIWAANAAVIHFAAPRRSNAAIHNARAALVAGIAYGLGKQLLMVAEEEYQSPFDYQDILHVHSSSKQLGLIFDAWFAKLNPAIATTPLSDRRDLQTALQQLNFYEYVAEQESDTLDEYFVRTSEYESVLSSRSVLFVGRKGVGKTANMIEASRALGEDRRNLVCVIKPVDYELTGLVDVLRRYQGKESRNYLIENMWKLLIYTELARTLIQGAETRPSGIGPRGALADLRDFVDQRVPSVREDFALRLEQIVESLLQETRPDTRGIGMSRDNIGAALGGVLMRDLRERLETALSHHERVAILIDNLDKAWDRHADLDDLSQLLLGLLTTVGRVANEFRKGTGNDDLMFSLAIFLRDDIYQHLIRVAREPDKIKAASITWDDRNLLFRVIDERFVASSGAEPGELWSRFICATVDEVPAREYLFSRILPRPRDLLFLINDAMANAVNAGHQEVLAEDIKNAEQSYSRFAFEAALVANSITTNKLEELLYEFVGSPAVITEHDIESALTRAGISSDVKSDVTDHLLTLQFIGREVGEKRFSYESEGPRAKVTAVLARKTADAHGGLRRYRIHPAFCPFLEIVEEDIHSNA